MRNTLNTEKEGKHLAQLHNTGKMKPEGVFSKTSRYDVFISTPVFVTPEEKSMQDLGITLQLRRNKENGVTERKQCPPRQYPEFSS